jgi:hypothetical protein
VYIVLARPSGACRSERLNSNVRPHKYATHDMRPPHAFELDFFRQALGIGGWGPAAQVLEEALAVEVHPEDLDYHHIQLVYPGGTPIGRRSTLVREWRANDLDGAVIEILVFSDEAGRMQELEMHRVDCQPMQRMPVAESAQPVCRSSGQSPRTGESAA